MNNMRTIIYYGNVYYPNLDAASHRTIGNAKVLREIGYKVVLIGTRKGEIRPLLETYESFEGFDIYYFPDPKSSSEWWNYLFYFEPLKQILEVEPDVSHIVLYNHPSVSSKRIHTYCIKRGILVYADCTEWFDPKGNSIHAAIKKMDTWYRMRVVNKRLDGIIAISSFLQNYYRNKDCKTICVPPLVDINDAKWAKVSLANIENKDEIIRLCYVGNPGAGEKDKLNYILDALNRVSKLAPNVKFQINIVGMTEQQFEEVFKVDTSKYEFANFMGRKPNSEALTIVKNSDFSIFLRDTNLVCTAGFPTKFSESIACGTPVLTNLSSDLGTYIIVGKNGYILDLSSEKKLDESLLHALLTPKDELTAMKQYCLEERTFDYHSFVGEFRKMF